MGFAVGMMQIVAIRVVLTLDLAFAAQHLSRCIYSFPGCGTPVLSPKLSECLVLSLLPQHETCTSLPSSNPPRDQQLWLLLLLWPAAYSCGLGQGGFWAPGGARPGCAHCRQLS